MDIEYIKEYYKAKEEVWQGQMSFGNHTQSSVLSTCLSIILFSPRLKIGGLSHIDASKNNKQPYSFPDKVINQFQNYQIKYNIEDSKYFIVGGLDYSKYILDDTEKELQKNRIPYSLVDVLGKHHRKVILFPKENKLKIHVQNSSLFV